MTKIKICGLFRPEDIEFVNFALPDWCGFIINFPKSHRSVTPEQVRTLRAGLSDSITPVGVFVDRPAEEAAALLNDGTVSIAQLHGDEDDEYIARLRSLVKRAPAPCDVQIWKAFKVRSPADLTAVEASAADLVLLDNGYGTGEAFDWSVARSVKRPFILAGGLTPENIPRAVEALHPYGLDLSSGVEVEKKKDFGRIRAAVAAAHR